MIYSYVVQQPEHHWLMQTGKILLLALEKFMKYLAVPLACCCHSFILSQVVIRLVPSSSIPHFNMIVELGSSNIIAEPTNNKVTKFIQRYVYRGKIVEGITKTRMRHKMKLKRKRWKSFYLILTV